MPRHGSRTLSDLTPEPILMLACEPCGRRGQYSVAWLIEEHGADAKLTDLLVTLANCQKGASTSSIHDRCKARYVSL
jgi:hypothetical protein